MGKYNQFFVEIEEYDTFSLGIEIGPWYARIFFMFWALKIGIDMDPSEDL